MEELKIATNSVNKRKVLNQIEYGYFVVESSRKYQDLHDNDDKYNYLIEEQDKLNQELEMLDNKRTLTEHEADFIRTMIRTHEEEHGENQENEDDESLKKEVLNDLGYEDGTIIR